MDNRMHQLKNWAEQKLGINSSTITTVAGDASFRRYFRISSEDISYIAVDAPPEHEDCKPFIHVALAFLKQNINVPKIIAHDLECGWMLLSDLGDTLYLDVLDENNADKFYSEAFEALVKIQQCKIELPQYDNALLQREMALFKDWFIIHHLGHSLSSTEEKMLQGVFDTLADSALQQPAVCVHRDYHSRNLMVCDHNPGVIDFQDAVTGAVTYDLVSLLRDCYISWPIEKVYQWAKQYRQMALDANILSNHSEDTFIQWFDWMGMQRQLKAIGIFSRLNHRDGKDGYLKDIPRTFEYIATVMPNYPELKKYQNWFADMQSTILERCALQPQGQ